MPDTQSHNLALACPALGMDLDGTVDVAPAFFQFLSRSWPGKVYVITFRDDRAKAVADAASWGVQAEVVLVESLNDKADRIRELGIKVFFDDMDEVLLHIPEDVAVFKVRNGGNFCFDTRKWLYSKQTGRQIGARE
jgi:hypothetical protein